MLKAISVPSTTNVKSVSRAAHHSAVNQAVLLETVPVLSFLRTVVSESISLPTLIGDAMAILTAPSSGRVRLEDREDVTRLLPLLEVFVAEKG